MKTNHNPNTNYLLSGKSANQIAQAVNWLDENRTYLDETGHHRKNYFPGEIRVKYSGENMLPMFSAVILSDLIGVDLSKGLVYDTPSFQVRTATASDSSEIQFAVTTEPAVADSCVKAVLSGIVPAKIIVRDQAHQFVQPLLDGSGQLESCESSIAKILYKAAGTGEQWAMLQIGSAGAGGGSYNGYFVIKTRTIEDVKKIVVCDGKTYDAKEGRSGDSLVMVNGLMRSAPYTEFDIPSDQHRYIYVKYISILEDAASGDRCEIRLGSEDDISEETAIALIGEITKKESGDISITQRHGTILSKSTNGVPYIDWTYACEMSYVEN